MIYVRQPPLFYSRIAGGAASSNQLRPSGLLLGRLSSGQRRPIVLRALRLLSWVVFAYEPFPNQLRPSGLLLGRLSKKEPPRMRGFSHHRAEARCVSTS